ALDRDSWDIVICDFVMPRFSGLAALRLLQQKGLDLPCIIISGKAGEDIAVSAMKAGAQDFITKDNLSRLGPAIERELNEASIRQESRQAAEDLGRAEEELRILQKMDQMKDEFLGLVSHEMRNPLTVVIGSLNTMLTDWENLSREEMQQLLGDALWEAENLSDILSNLLELARAQAGRLEFHEEPLPFKQVIDTVIARIKRRSPTHEFVFEYAEPLVVTTDRIKLERILFNLLDNAAKYSPEGSVVRIFAQCDEATAMIGISDQGSGISQEDQSRLFKPFERLDASGMRAGTGLGLVVCQRLVEAQHGRIWVVSETGKGATFYFTVPVYDEPVQKTES
ncbi:MAG: response regulator, partial [Chloroflexi bacterium]|nr:response regulator [Chloroflexota bacterium]